VGCGAGGNLELLARWAEPVVGLDRSGLALELAREKRPAAALVLGDANRLEAIFEPCSFALITVFNVLYHRWIEDEAHVLRQLRTLLRPGGRLVISEPAFPCLFRRHDVLDFGQRRYRLRRLRALATGAGLHVLRDTYFNAPVFLPALTLALLERARGGRRRPVTDDELVGELRQPPAWVNGAMLGLLGAERAWITRVGRVPLGVGALLVARRAD